MGSADLFVEGKPRLALRCLPVGTPASVRSATLSVVTQGTIEGEIAILVAPSKAARSGGRLSFLVDGKPVLVETFIPTAPENVPFAKIAFSHALIPSLAAGTSLSVTAGSVTLIDGASLAGVAEVMKSLMNHCSRDVPGVSSQTAGALPAPDAASGGADGQKQGNALVSWERYGVKVHKGRLVFSDEYIPRNKRNEVVPDPLADPLQLLALSKLPKVEAIATVMYFGRFLRPEDRADLMRTPDVTENAYLKRLDADPFLQRDILNDFDRTYGPSIKTLAPSLPVKGIIVTDASLGRYDLDRGVFPLYGGLTSLGGGNTPIGVRLDRAGATIELDASSMATELPVPPDIARKIIEARAVAGMGLDRLEGFKLAIEISVSSVRVQENTANSGSVIFSQTQPGGLGVTLQASIERVVLYYDAALTQPMIEVPFEKRQPKVAAGTKSPVKAAPERAEGSGTSGRLGAWITRSEVIGIAKFTGVSDSVLARLIPETRRVRDASDFDRPTVQAQTQAAMLAVLPQPPGGTRVVPGRVTFSGYDGTNLTLARWSFGEMPEQAGDDQLVDWGQIAFRIENEAALGAFPMVAEDARALTKNGQQMTFPVLLEVAPGVTSAVTNDARPVLQVGLKAVAIHLLDPEDKTRPIASHRIVEETDAPAFLRPEDLPPVTVDVRPVLTPELITMLQIKASGRAADDLRLNNLLITRQAVEANEAERVRAGDLDVLWRNTSPCGRFLPKGQARLTQDDIIRLKPSFAVWLERCIAALPSEFVIDWAADRTFDPNGSPFGVAPQDVRAFEAVSQGRAGYSSVASGTGMMAISDLGEGVSGLPAALRSFYGTDGFNDDLVLLLPKLVQPGGVSASAVSMDVKVSSLQTVPRQGNQLPLLVSTPEIGEVRWLSGNDTSAGRTLMAAAVPDVTRFQPPDPNLEGPLAGPQYDLVGLKLGMSEAEARAAIAAHMTIDRVLQLTSPHQPPYALGQRAQLFINPEGTDFITLLYGPDTADETVFGVTRSWFVPRGQIDEARMNAALTGKYGVAEAGVRSTWLPEGAGVYCGSEGTQGQINWGGVPVMEGRPFPTAPLQAPQIMADPALQRDVVTMLRADRLSFGLGLTNYDTPEPCGSVIRAALFENHRAAISGLDLVGSSADVMVTWLTDPGTYYRAAQESLNQAAPGGDVEIKL